MEGDLFAADLDRPGIGLEHAGEDVHQRRLAGAVLTEECVHLAGAHVQARAA